MKQKLSDLLGYLLFLGLFILLIPVLMVSGAIQKPIRYYKYVSSQVHNKKHGGYNY